MNIQIQAVMLLLVAAPGIALAQTPVDEDGVILGAYEPAYGVQPEIEPLGNEDIPKLSETELEDLVGPIALYPDDLLAIVLPAAAYPLQIVEAARFLEALETDSSLKPDPEWDDSVVALLNYPEVVELLNDDIDWTWRLGEAVVAQQGDVVSAIESFRDRAYAAGNLQSDEYQNVTRDEGAIEITPVSDDVIYVPYYEPERVVVYQPRRVYYYYPRAYPVYYYPYSSAYHFDRGFFWGVTTAFTIGWVSDSLHVYHHSYHGHPYYGRHYWDRWWYRRPSIQVYNTTYVRRPNVTINRYYDGDRWEARHERRDYMRRDGRVTRNRHTPPTREQRETRIRPARRDEPIQFRDRPERRQPAVARRENREAGVGQRDVRRDQRRDATVRQRQDRRETAARSERRESTTREQRRQPERQVSREQREAVVRDYRQQRSQPERQVRQERRQPERQVRQERRQPERQVRQERRQPERQVRQERRQPESRAPARRSEPQRQSRSERRESKSESRSSNNRGKARGNSERRSRR